MLECVLVVGPTGSGKSRYADAIDSAQIINADSQQVYKSLSVLRATPKCRDNYSLYAYLHDHELINAAVWTARAADEINESVAAGKTPVVVGGTALYIDALLRGISPVPSVPKETRARVKQLQREELLEYQKCNMPEFRFTDLHRLQRAVEVHLYTGKTITEWQQQPRTQAVKNIRFEVIYSAMPSKDSLRARIEEMIECGAVEQVEQIGEYTGVVKPIGLDMIRSYIAGYVSRETLARKWCDEMYQYAKRQCTFFNKVLAVASAERNGIVVRRRSC